MIHIRNYVGNEFHDAMDGSVLDILNPATNQTIGSMPRSKSSDCDRGNSLRRIFCYDVVTDV